MGVRLVGSVRPGFGHPNIALKEPQPASRSPHDWGQPEQATTGPRLASDQSATPVLRAGFTEVL